MPKELTAQEIADKIRANPNGVMTVDNDCWWLKPAKPEDCGDDALDRWYDSDGVADGGDLWTLTEAFAIIAGITVGKAMSHMGNHVVGLQENPCFQDGYTVARTPGEVRHCFVLQGQDKEAWLLGWDTAKEDLKTGDGQ